MASPFSRLHLLVVLLLGSAFLMLGAGTAHAADGYRYWNYFHVVKGDFAFAKTGASDYTPKNGAVEAYRYGTSATADGLTPRADLTTYTFAHVCDGTPTDSDHKRVAVLIDFGTTADAAEGETPPAPRAGCASVPTGANGQQVLDAVADVRTGQGLICGVDGYPTATCSVTVKNPSKPAPEKDVAFALPAAASPSASASSSASPSDGSSPSSGDSTNASAESESSSSSGLYVAIGIALVAVLIAGGAIAINRRSGRGD